ncbi:hypothetical protein [Burkholderia phage FLC9]|nr:hypothetical protein [Burkholderia phage FLC9]
MKKSLNRIALEAERVEEVRAEGERTEELRRVEMAEPVTNEPELIDVERAADDADGEYEIEQSDAVAIEQLCAWRDLLAHQIQSKTVSLESIAMVQMGVQQIYARQGVRMRTISQESNMSVEAYGKYVMEGIFGAIGNSIVLPFKRWKDRLGDLFRTLPSQAEKYRSKLTTAREELHQKPFSGAAEINMHELWGFFTTGEGQAVKTLATLQKDLAMDKYVLVDYPQQLGKLVQQAAGIIGNGDWSTDEGAKRAALELEKLPHPADLFNKQFLSEGKKPYLGVTGLDLQVGAKRKVLSIGGVALPKLAELASAKRVTETGSLGHDVANLAGKIGGKIVGNAVNTASIVLSKNVKMSQQDLDKLITFGEEYVNNVDAYLKGASQLNGAFEALDAAIEKHSHGKYEAGAGAVLQQAAGYADQLVQAWGNPAVREVRRALRGARFVAYMARRGIFHGSNSGQSDQKTHEGTVGEQGGEAAAA